MKRVVLFLVCSLFVSGVAPGAIRRVPKLYPTIQKAINACKNGDTVLVSNGRYRENINFLGKRITVKTVNGPSVTSIDGQFRGSVVTFATNEPPGTVLQGFTIWQGTGTLIGGSTAGGGIRIAGASPTITQCVIMRNRADRGAGIYVGGSSAPTISGNLIVSNFTSSVGAGIFFDRTHSSGRIESNIIRNNLAFGQGGGIECDWAWPTIAGNVIAGNVAGRSGAGIDIWDGSPAKIENCTIVANTALFEGGGLCLNGHGTNPSPTVKNTILWGNHASVGPQIHERFAKVKVSYSDVAGGWPGTGNMSADPQLANPGRYVFNVLPGSPCIDKGTNSVSLPPPATDVDGQTWKNNGVMDIGADEYHDGTVCHIQLAVAGNAAEMFVIGKPRSTYLFLGSLQPLIPPARIPGIGGLLRITAPFVFPSSGKLGASGVVRVGMSLPSPPASPGATIWTQALVGNTQAWKFSNLDAVTYWCVKCW